MRSAPLYRRAAGSSLALELQRTLDGAGGAQGAARPAALPTAEAVLDLLSEQRERAVVGLNASGQVRELQLRLRIRFRLRTLDGTALIPDTELLQQRDISYSETIALAKGSRRGPAVPQHADRPGAATAASAGGVKR